MKDKKPQDVSNKAIKRTLSSIWQEQKDTRELMEQIQLQLRKNEQVLPEALKQLGEKFVVLADAQGAVEPVNIDGLLEELKAIKEFSQTTAGKEAPEMPDPVEFPEVQKIAGEVEVKELSSIADKIAEKLAPMVGKNGEVKITNLPEQTEIFGKTITKIEGSRDPKDPLAVRLSDGDKFVDLERLFNISVSGGGGGGGGIAAGDTIGTESVNYAVRKREVGDFKYLALAPPGTSTASAAWRCFRVDKSVTGGADITWADGDDNFDNVADDLTTLNYL